MSFSPTEVCFEGFRVTRHRFGAVMLWALVWLVGVIVVVVAAAPFILPFSEEIQAAQGNQAALSPQAQAALDTASYVVLPVLALLQGLLAPAVYRAVLRPQDKSFGSLRLGRDEARITAVVFVIALISLVCQVGGEWLAVRAGELGGILLAMPVRLGVLVLTTWIALRLSLVAPATFAERKFAIRQALALSRRHLWPLLGITIISTVMAMLVLSLVVLTAWPAVAMIMTSGAAPGPWAPLAALVVIAALPVACALASVIVWAPFAAAYRDLSINQPVG